MKLWEILRDWENGWRGIAIDNIGFEHDFTGTVFVNRNEGRSVNFIGEEWTVKEEVKEEIKSEVNNINLNITINSTNFNPDEFTKHLIDSLRSVGAKCSSY